MKSPLLQLKRTIASLNVGNVAHQLKTYDILLIAILPQQRVSHTACIRNMILKKVQENNSVF